MGKRIPSHSQARGNYPGRFRHSRGHSAFEYAIGARWPRVLLAGLFLAVLAMVSHAEGTIHLTNGTFAASCRTTTTEDFAPRPKVAGAPAVAMPAACGQPCAIAILCPPPPQRCPVPDSGGVKDVRPDFNEPCPTTTTTIVVTPPTTKRPPTTTTTTVAPPTTTTATTVAPTTTTTSKPKTTLPTVTTIPTVTTPTSAATTSTTALTTTTTAPVTTTTTSPPPPPVTTPSQDLLLDHQSIPPGGAVSASGQGCSPNSTVQLSIGSVSVGSTTANGDGSFNTPLSVSVPVGQFDVVAVCGPTLHATLDVVLTSQASTPSGTAAILLILLLIALGVAEWQFSR